MRFSVESVNISREKGTQKHPVEEIELVENFGIKGDGHAGFNHRQVSLLSIEEVETMKLMAKEKGIKLEPGAFGENINTKGLDCKQAKVGRKIIINKVILEITQIGKTCHDRCAIYDAVGECIMPEHGIFTRVIKGGIIRVNDNGYYCL